MSADAHGKPTKAPVEIFRKDYKQPDYWVHEVDLVVKIYEESAQILSTMRAHPRMTPWSSMVSISNWRESA